MIKGKWYKFRPYSSLVDVWYLKYDKGDVYASEYIESSQEGKIIKYHNKSGTFSSKYIENPTYVLCGVSEFAHLLPKNHPDLLIINYLIY